MFTIESLYPVMILMNVVVGCLLLFVFWGKQDRSSTLWAWGCFIFVIGIAMVLAGSLIPPSVRFIGANFATFFPFFLFVRSIICLFEEKPLRLWLGGVISLGFGVGVFLLVLAEQRFLIPIYVGIGFCSVQLWAAYALRQINRIHQNTYLRFFSVLFVFGGLVWLVRGLLSQLFKFEFAPDPALANWIVMFAITGFVLLRQIAYLLLRFGRTQEEKEVIQKLNERLGQTIEQKNILIKTLSTSVKANQLGGQVAGIVHEISQPLSAIAINTELLIKTSHQPTDLSWQIKILSYIQQDNERAAGIISRLRDFYKKGDKNFTRFDLSALAIRVIDIAMPNNSSQPFKIKHSLQPGVFVSGDQGEIEMVVLNLLTNAISALNIKSPDPFIRVALTTQAQDAIIEVKDNGVGVPVEQQQEIFNLFHTTKTQGMGVGLWLSRTIIENHQGRLELAQTADAVTCFRITIPRVI